MASAALPARTSACLLACQVYQVLHTSWPASSLLRWLACQVTNTTRCSFMWLATCLQMSPFSCLGLMLSQYWLLNATASGSQSVMYMTSHLVDLMACSSAISSPRATVCAGPVRHHVAWLMTAHGSGAVGGESCTRAHATLLSCGVLDSAPAGVTCKEHHRAGVIGRPKMLTGEGCLPLVAVWQGGYR